MHAPRSRKGLMAWHALSPGEYAHDRAIDPAGILNQLRVVGNREHIPWPDGFDPSQADLRVVSDYRTKAWT
jgi:hypothetical protein